MSSDQQYPKYSDFTTFAEDNFLEAIPIMLQRMVRSAYVIGRSEGYDEGYADGKIAGSEGALP